MADILIIDDSPSFRRIIARTLSAAGHQTREAKDGVEGVAVYRAHHPALVITDIVMPLQGGIQTILELRREAPYLPILAISGNLHGSFYLHAATVLGANASLQKPFSPRKLLSTVAKLLARHARQQSPLRPDRNPTPQSLQADLPLINKQGSPCRKPSSPAPTR